MDIQPKYVTFAELISNRLFKIPEYQRAYSWRRKQRDDLFEDINNLTGKPNGSTHFMATIVGLQRERKTINTDEYTRLDIVDGQQRLTTLILLCKAIEKSLSETDRHEQALQSELAGRLVKDASGTLLLLQTNHDKSTYFANYLRNGDVPEATDAALIADRELANAIVECEQFVSTWRATKSVLDLAALLKNRLTFIFHETTDEAAVYTVFEVLNSRGLEVSWLDRMKSTLMAIAFEYAPAARAKRDEIIKELHQVWGAIYDAIGLRQELSSETLRFAATLLKSEQGSKVLSDEKALECIAGLCAGKVKKRLELSEWLRRVAVAVADLEGDVRRAAVTKIAHGRLLAVAVELSKFQAKQKRQLAEQWERVTFRMFGIARKDARTGVGEFVRLSQKIQAMTGTAAEHKEAMNELRKLGSEKYPIEEAVKSLQNADCYEGWEEELRYFLFRYEEHLATETHGPYKSEQWRKIWAESASRSIEHVHPQTPTLNGPWKGALGPGRGQREAHVNRLGNLALLPPGLNSKVGNRDFNTKKAEYRRTGLLILDEICRKNKWDKTAIEEREQRLVKFAKEAWADL